MVKYKKISVLIIFHNEERTLRETLQNVFLMDYPKELIEVVCVDDGSTDMSATIARQFPVILIEQKRSWLSGAYNAGIEQCTGDYILKLDAHMYLKNKDTFKIINEYFLTSDKIAGVCGTYVSLKDNDRNFVRDIRRLTIFKKNHQFLDINLGNFTTWSSAIGAYKREIFETNQFPEEFVNSYGEDIYLQIILHNQGYNFIYTPEIVGIHDAAIDNRQLLKKMEYEIKAAGNILLKASSTRAIEVPYLHYFLSYPLLSIILLSISIVVPYMLILFVTVCFIFEVIPALEVFKVRQYSFKKRSITCCYLIIKELIQAIYLPLYIFKKSKSIKQFITVYLIIIKWEAQKFGLSRMVLD